MDPLVILLPLAYAFADRFGGGGLPALDDRLPGRAVFWGALLCAGVGYLVFGPPAAVLALVWLVYRTPGWKVFGGSATPTNPKEIAGTFARHIMAMPMAVPVGYWFGLPYLMFVVAFTAYAVASTLLAMWYSKTKNADGDNAFLETARGALFGAAVVVSMGVF